jgi:hypothetical protein
MVADEDRLVTEHDRDVSVVADAVSIYAGGKLTAVAIQDLLNNEVAVRQLINDYNQTKRQPKPRG